MSDLFSLIAATVAIFASTNIDDIVVLTVLFLASNASGRPTWQQIVTGQYAGITVLVVLSVVAAFGLTLIPNEWVSLFGLIPLGLGLYGIVMAIKDRKSTEKRPVLKAAGFASVAGITIANGGDNIAVYTPFFHRLDGSEVVVVVLVFALLVAGWCYVAAMLGGHKRLIGAIQRFGHWIVPVVFVVVGLVVLLH